MSALTTWFTGMRGSVRPVTHFRSDRYWEVDAWRGFAITIMVIYHLMWDLYGLAGWNIEMYTGFWHYWQLVTASSFIGLVGVSMSLRAGRMRQKGDVRFLPFFQRGLVIFSWGMVVSLVTWFVSPEVYVRFGILHFIGVAIILAYPFLRFRWLNLILGAVLLLIPEVIPWRHDIAWLEWLGMAANPHPAFDYFPVIPWLGVVLIGIFLGNMLYPKGKRAFHMPDWSRFAPVRWLALAGQNSLLIYLIHQPVLITILVLMGVVKLF
jgi:uncharacterized membrane protein